MRTTRRDAGALRVAIDHTGYYPEVVTDGVFAAVAGEDVLSFYVHHEPTFSHDQIHRHVTVLALTQTRLIVGHTDDQPAEPPNTGSYAASSTESVSLSKIGTVVLTRVVADPEKFRAGAGRVSETWLSVGWGAMRRIDLEQAGCADPDCEADHGYTGTMAGDDLTVRMSAEIEGDERVARLVRFATTLQRATAR